MFWISFSLLLGLVLFQIFRKFQNSKIGGFCFAGFAKLCFASVLHLCTQVLYRKVPFFFRLVLKLHLFLDLVHVLSLACKIFMRSQEFAKICSCGLFSDVRASFTSKISHNYSICQPVICRRKCSAPQDRLLC